MELGVLLKAVPRSEELRFDPEARRIVRDRTGLVSGPLDQRALRIALELRRPSDRVVVISLGPPPARPLLREALALGADRAVHLCDPAFAGSDVLATATVLAAAVRRARAELVLAGSRSIDGETALIGPTLAGLLDRPVVTGARSVRRGGPGEPWEVAHDTRRGRATAHVRLPFVLTVGEKITKPLHLEPEAFDRQGEEAIETVGPTELGLSVGEVGSFASPTTVGSVEEVAPPRTGSTFRTGSVADRVRAAVATLVPLLDRSPPEPSPLPWAPAYDPTREVAVLVSDSDGSLSVGAPSVLGHLARSLPTYTISAVAYGGRPAGEATGRLAGAGARRAYLLETGGDRFDAGDVARATLSFAAARPKLAAIVTEATAFGREVAGQLAGRHLLGAVADAIDVQEGPPGELSWTKPSFGGSTLARIVCRSAPVVATVPPGLGRTEASGPAGAELDWLAQPTPAPVGAIERTDPVDEPIEGPDPESSSVVVAVGTGIGGPEGIVRLRPALRRWGAALVGTRKVVDAGWLPPRVQAGLTGLHLAPRLAVLLGVRGVVNHTIGWRRAGTILAVNSDPEAPVFAGADVGILGKIDEVVPELTEPLALALGGPRRA